MLDIFRNEPETRAFAPGETLFSEGDPAPSHMHAILEGEVEILRGGRVVGRASAGEIVGEMALIDHVPRSATVRALAACRTALVSERRFLFLVQQHPAFALAMLRMLTHRLRGNLES